MGQSTANMTNGWRKLVKRVCLVSMVTVIVLLTIIQLVGLDGCCQHKVECCSSNPSPEFLHTFPHRQWGPNKDKLILLWTPFFGGSLWGNVDSADPWAAFEGCPQSRCRLTWNQKNLLSTDAVLFHAFDLWNYWRGLPLPTSRVPHQVWVLANFEPPPHLPLDLSRLNNVFNWTLSYRSHSDVEYVIGALVRRNVTSRETIHNSAVRHSPGEGIQDLSPEGEAIPKTRTAAWMASNCNDHARRRRLVRALSNYIQVDTFGACGDEQPNCTGHLCSEVLSRYKFYLSFENSLCRDYVTEKLWHVYKRGQVPVVLGGADYAARLPPHSFINVADFASMQELGLYLQYLDRDDKAYAAYLQWRKLYQLVYPRYWCDLCAELHNRSKPAQVYSDLQAWFRHGELESCPQFSLTNYLSRSVDALLINIGM